VCEDASASQIPTSPLQASCAHQRRRAVGALARLAALFAQRFPKNGSKQRQKLVFTWGAEAWQAHMLAGVINGELSGQLPLMRVRGTS